MQINNSLDKESSRSSQNPLLIQTISDTNFEERFNLLNFKAEQNKTAFDEVSEKEAKSQTEPCNLFNFKDKNILLFLLKFKLWLKHFSQVFIRYNFLLSDNCGYKCCHNEIKLCSTVLLEVSKKLDSVLINQAIIVRSVNPDYAKSMIPSNIPSIPLKTKENFENMETFLATNCINYETMVNLLWCLLICIRLMHMKCWIR